jgi:hypothetical protein
VIFRREQTLKNSLPTSGPFFAAWLSRRVMAHRENNFWRFAEWQCGRGLQGLLIRITKSLRTVACGVKQICVLSGLRNIRPLLLLRRSARSVCTASANFARIPVCEPIAQYNAAELPPGPDRLPLLMRAILARRLTFRGFLYFDYASQFPRLRH